MSAPYNRNQSVALLSSLKTGVVFMENVKKMWGMRVGVFFLGGGW